MAWRLLLSQLLFGLGLGCCSVGAYSQTMYRCGSTYQDQPCASAQPGKVIGATRASGGDSGAASSSRCMQRGMDAEKIAWAREGGKTMQQQLGAGAYDAGLTQDVYLRRGTAAEIRAAIQQDCDAQELRAMTTPGVGLPAAALAPRAPVDAGVAERAQEQEQARAHDQAARDNARMAEAHQNQCASLATQASNVAEQMRHNNDRNTMNSLTQQGYAIQNQQRSAGC